MKLVHDLLEKAASLNAYCDQTVEVAKLVLAGAGVEFEKSASEFDLSTPELENMREAAKLLEKAAAYISDIEQYADKVEAEKNQLLEKQAKLDVEKQAFESPAAKLLVEQGFSKEDVIAMSVMPRDVLEKVAHSVGKDLGSMGSESSLPAPVNGTNALHAFCLG